ncbi:quinone oxidoreductase, NADPH-dependent [Pseudescherichia vulneris]|nr:quinone oxidoreductase, NADPH-dependent [Pseudescherichia vulneris]
MSEQAYTLPDTMTAIDITQPGGPEVLQATTRPVPRPQANEVLIRTVAAGVNGPDVLQRKGQYAPPPGASDIPGLEVSGMVVAVGAEVQNFVPGIALQP